mgnify:CR=1 FL=1
MSKLDHLPNDQILALYTWMRRHRRHWRSNLRRAWNTGDYGSFRNTDTAAALQRLRNWGSAMTALQNTTERALRSRVHHIVVCRAAQNLLDKLAVGQGHVYTPERVTLEGLLQEEPGSYDRDL